MGARTSFAKRHPLGTFFGLTFVLTWAAMAVWLQGGGEAISSDLNGHHRYDGRNLEQPFMKGRQP